MNSLDDYPGAKGGPGVWQTIINNTPPHDLWIEAFAGSAIVTRRKRPALASIVIDADAAVTPQLQALIGKKTDEGLPAGTTVICADAISWLHENGLGLEPRRAVIYCDPPYLGSVRGMRSYYRVEMMEEDMHEHLLWTLRAIADRRPGVPCMVSGYRSPLYNKILRGWRRVDYQTATHGGKVTESLWCSFPEPQALHDYRFLGQNFRQRQDFKRKLQRWKDRLRRMPILERRVIAAALGESADGGDPSAKVPSRTASAQLPRVPGGQGGEAIAPHLHTPPAP